MAVSPLRVSRKIAFRYLWSRRAEAFITIISVTSVIGVALGVLVLTVVMAVMTGFQHELREKIVGANAHITVRTIEARLEGWRETIDAISGVPGVESVSPYTYHQALIRTEGGASGVLIRGIVEGTSAADQVAGYLPEPAAIDKLFSPPPVISSENKEVTLPGLVIGRELARSIGAFPGSTVALMSPLVSATPFGLTPRLKRFIVTGLYSSGLVEYESGLAYAKLEDAQQFFQMGDAVSGIEVRVKEIDKAPVVGRAISELLGGARAGFIVQDWTELNRPLWDAIRLEKRVYFLVLLLIIVMASFSIISTLVMLVLEKRKDIAILRTMGATASTIANIFRIQGAAIGGAGVLLGLTGGLITCLALREYGFPLDQKVFQMTELPVRIDPLNFCAVGAAAFAICVLATIYPSRRASRMEPRDILRYE